MLLDIEYLPETNLKGSKTHGLIIFRWYGVVHKAHARNSVGIFWNSVGCRYDI